MRNILESEVYKITYRYIKDNNLLPLIAKNIIDHPNDAWESYNIRHPNKDTDISIFVRGACTDALMYGGTPLSTSSIGFWWTQSNEGEDFWREHSDNLYEKLEDYVPHFRF